MNPWRKWRSTLPNKSFAAAGRLLGVSGPQMWRYETGKRRVPPEKVGRYSAITGIAPEVLRPDVFGPIVTENGAGRLQAVD